MASAFPSKRLTVIVPTCNRRDTLARCLQALERQTAPRDAYEVVVVDDGSTDDTPAMLAAMIANRKTDLALKTVRQANRGPAAARNLGLGVADGELLLIVNDDTILSDTAVERHLAAHERAAGSKTIVLGNFRILPEYKTDLFTACVDSTTFMFPFCRLTTRELLDFSYFITCNTSLPRAAFDEAGTFDESFPKPAGEDIEMGYRLSRAGWRIVFDPDLMSWHDSLFTPASYARARFIRGEEDLRFLHKHPEQVGAYQRYALSFAKSHERELMTDRAGYGTYVDGMAAETGRLIAAYGTAGGSAERYRIHQKLMGRIEAIGYLAYAHGAAASPFFAEVMEKTYPQTVF